MAILGDSYHGLTFDEWCGKVGAELKDVDKAVIQKEIASLTEHHWKVQYMEDKKRGKIYVHLDLLL
jgi:hypothetical protein